MTRLRLPALLAQRIWSSPDCPLLQETFNQPAFFSPLDSQLSEVPGQFCPVTSFTLSAPTTAGAAAFPNLALSPKHPSPPGSGDGVTALTAPLLPPLWVCTFGRNPELSPWWGFGEQFRGGKCKLAHLGTVTPPSLSNRLHSRPRPAWFGSLLNLNHTIQGASSTGRNGSGKHSVSGHPPPPCHGAWRSVTH